MRRGRSHCAGSRTTAIPLCLSRDEASGVVWRGAWARMCRHRCSSHRACAGHRGDWREFYGRAWRVSASGASNVCRFGASRAGAVGRRLRVVRGGARTVSAAGAEGSDGGAGGESNHRWSSRAGHDDGCVGGRDAAAIPSSAGNVATGSTSNWAKARRATFGSYRGGQRRRRISSHWASRRWRRKPPVATYFFATHTSST